MGSLRFLSLWISWVVGKYFLSWLIVRRDIKGLVLTFKRLFLEFESIFETVETLIWDWQGGFALFSVDFFMILNWRNLADLFEVPFIIILVIFFVYLIRWNIFFSNLILIYVLFVWILICFRCREMIFFMVLIWLKFVLIFRLFVNINFFSE